MRGMKSLVAPSVRHSYADGGVIGAVKGMLGIKPEDPERARRIAEYKANADREREAAKAAATRAPAPAPAITDYASGGALKRREAAAGLKDGGPVRGPGTGTSDDVPDEVPEGTYIMPTDSTKAIGEGNLASMGARGMGDLGAGKTPAATKVPVNLSDGEYKLPPAQVHAIGVKALNQMKDATHTPASVHEGGVSRGMKPELFFASGGVVEDEETAAGAPTPTAPMPAAPPPAVKDPLDGGAAFGVFPQLAGGKRTTYAMDDKLRTGVEATGPSTFAQATPLEKTIVGGGTGQRMDAAQDPRSLTAAGMGAIAGASPSAAPATPGAAQPGLPAAGGEVAGSPLSASGSITRNGNSYSGPANITGDVTIRNPDGSMRQPGGGFMVTPGGASSVGASSGMNFALDAARQAAMARGDLDAVAASYGAPVKAGPSLSLPGGSFGIRRDRNIVADERGAQSRFAYAQGTDPASRRRAAGMQQLAMQEQGAITRARIGNEVPSQRLGMDAVTQGFANRAAAQLEQLQAAYAAEKDPAEQAVLARKMRDLQGKNVQQDVWAHSPGGQVVDPKTQQLITQPGVIYNRATGEMRADAGANRLPPLAENPAVQQIMNNTGLSREDRAKQIRALGYQ